MAKTAGDDAGQNATPPRAPAIWEKAFLKALSRTGNVSEACRAAKIERSTVYRHRDADKVFAALWVDAQSEAADWLEKEAYRRAVTGWLEPVYQRGEKVGTVRKYSDQLLIRLLEANNPDKFKRRMDMTSDGEKLPIAIIKMDVGEL